MITHPYDVDADGGGANGGGGQGSAEVAKELEELKRARREAEDEKRRLEGERRKVQALAQGHRDSLVATSASGAASTTNEHGWSKVKQTIGGSGGGQIGSYGNFYLFSNFRARN